MKTPKEVLQGFLQVLARASQIAIDRNSDSGVIDFTETTNKADKSIKEYYLSLLPEEKEVGFECSNCGHWEKFEQEIMCWKCGKGEMIFQSKNRAFNQSIREMRDRIKGCT